MNCREFRSHLHAYIDGELGVEATLAAQSHAAECPRCGQLADAERAFRAMVRQAPQEPAPPQLRARILAMCRAERRRGTWRPRLVWPSLAAAAAALVLMLWPTGWMGRTPDVQRALVDTHVAYAQLERPAEFTSAARADVEAWFVQRIGMQVPVPDYTPAGIRLIGGRVASAGGRKVAYVLYEKGHVLMSVFVAPADGAAARLRGEDVVYLGHRYAMREDRGYRTVSWEAAQVVFTLVSALDPEALLKCADRLRAEQATRL